MRRLKGSLIGVVSTIALLGAILVAPAAKADPTEFGLQSSSVGLSSYQAGGHPDFETNFEVKTDPASKENAFGLKRPYATVRDILVEGPAGLVGNPNAVEQCSVLQLESFAQPGGGCPNNTQVGVTRIYAYTFATTFDEPVFLMKPPGGETKVARLGFVAGIIPTFIDIEVRSDSDFGLNASIFGASNQAELIKAETTLWGVPSDPSHDTERCTSREAFDGCSASPPRPPGGNPEPFMIAPTECNGKPLPITVKADSYFAPGVYAGQDALLPPITGCDKVGFGPSLALTPTTREAASPSGVDAILTIPQDETVGGVASSTLKDAVVNLPPGMTLAAGAADGLVGCTAQEAHFKIPGPGQCPEASKLGSIEIEAPALEHPLHGSLYQRDPEPGNLFRVWAIANELGVKVSLQGEIKLDPQTGEIESLFLDSPQVPVNRIILHFKGGARGPLATPSACATYQTRWRFTPWSGTGEVSGTAPMTIDQNCATGGFSPKLAAGSEGLNAGTFTTFLTDITKTAEEQNLAGADVTLPPGLLAKLAGVPLCPDAQALTGECPAGSQIGTVAVASGPGPAPLWLPQPGRSPTAVYLSGPYKKAPYSLVVKVPAQAGPFDLGVVATRAAIQVDPNSAEVTVASDPLPQILEGVPVSYRHIHVAVDRPGFTINPTNCSPMAVKAKLTSNQGAIARPQSRFQVGGCADLAFKPKLSLRLFGKTNRGAHPRLKAVLKARPGDANFTRAQVALPRSIFLDQSHIKTICTRVQFAAEACPADSVYGKVRAITPLLDKPLEGLVYLRSSSNLLPDLVAALKGQVSFNLVGRIDSIRGGIRSTFEGVPDAPVTSFELEFQGGSKSLLEISRNLCKRPGRAELAFDAQNGLRFNQKLPLKTGCKKKG